MDSYTHNTGTFIGKGGNEIFFQSWTVTSPRGIMVIAHGIGEHSGRYMNIIREIEGENISVYALDHRGHGKSGGNRGHVDAFMDFVYDLKLFVNFVREQNAGLPLILLGHSMGGTIACRYALEYGDDLTGLILSSPAALIKVEIPAWKEMLGNFFSKALPGLSMSTNLDAGLLSHDKNEIEAYENDPLVHDKASARFFTEFAKAREMCINRAFELTMPILLFHGKEDGIVDYKGTELIYEKASSSNKQLHIFEGLYHETMNETENEKNKVLALVKKWTAGIIASKRAGRKPVITKKTATKPAVKKAAKKEKAGGGGKAAGKSPVKKGSAKKKAKAAPKKATQVKKAGKGKSTNVKAKSKKKK